MPLKALGILKRPVSSYCHCKNWIKPLTEEPWQLDFHHTWELANDKNNIKKKLNSSLHKSYIGVSEDILFCSNKCNSSVFGFAAMPRGRVCCQTSCGVSACRTWLSSILRMSWLCTRQTPAWDGTPWTRWAQGPARCPGPRALLHGRVRPHNTHIPHCIISSFTFRSMELCINTYVCPVCWFESPRGLCLTFIRAGPGLFQPTEVMWFKALQNGGAKHVILVGGEAWKEDALCLTTLQAGWLCGPDKLWTEYRERHRDSETMNGESRVAHLNLY